MTSTQSRFAPSILDPRDVSYVTSWDSEPEFGDRPSIEYRNALINQLAPEARERGGFGRCTMCGAYLRYVNVVELNSTGELFVVGDDCATNLEIAATINAKVNDLRAKASANRENVRKVERRENLLAANPELREAFELRDENDFLADVYAKAGEKNGLSDRQIEAVIKVAAKIREFNSKPVEVTVPVITGNAVEITGEVIWADNKPGYGYNQWVFKMIVRDDRGFKVYGTVPAAITKFRGENINQYAIKGHRVTFTASVSNSRDDESFGYFKSPKRARVIEYGNEN